MKPHRAKPPAANAAATATTGAAAAASPWPHRLALVVVLMVFPLVAIGGLVTTYEAGMSVVDWPTTYGHWFYPIQSWLRSNWDMFLEHGHRLWAQLTGAAAIVAGIVFWLQDRRRVARWLGALLIFGACLQGTLGGIRVLWQSDVLAMIHACTAALFFGLAVAALVVTSPRWIASPAEPLSAAHAKGLRRLALSLTCGLYAEILLGAQLRHHLPPGSPEWSEIWTWSKVLLAAALFLGCLALWRWTWRLEGPAEAARKPRAAAAWLVGGMSLQLILAAATWVTNYGWPLWFRRAVTPLEYTIVAEGPLQVTVTTLHVAVGLLAFAIALYATLWIHRLVRKTP